MGDQLEEVIKEIAAKHGIAVSRDDPILILQTINNRLMQDSARAQEAQLTIFKEEMEALTVRWGKESTEKAERVLNAALTASKGAMHKIMEEGGRAIQIAIRKEIEDAIKEAKAEAGAIRGIALLNVAAACISLVSVGLAIWSFFH